MSIGLPTFDMSTLAVGQVGNITFQNALGITADPGNLYKPAHLLIHNESGSGVLVNFQTGGDSFHLPAGGWRVEAMTPGEAGITFLVEYKLPNPPVQLFLVTYYAPGEMVPDPGVLGNSPIGIGGCVQTSSVPT